LPNCSTDFEDPIQDFYLDFKPPGPDSKGEDDCFNCDKIFTVEKIELDLFEIRG